MNLDAHKIKSGTLDFAKSGLKVSVNLVNIEEFKSLVNELENVIDKINNFELEVHMEANSNE